MKSVNKSNIELHDLINSTVWKMQFGSITYSFQYFVYNFYWEIYAVTDFELSDKFLIISINGGAWKKLCRCSNWENITANEYGNKMTEGKTYEQNQ